MTKLTRNMSDARSIAFWESVDRIAGAFDKEPEWMRAGIYLNEQHYETYRPRHASPPPADRPRGRGAGRCNADRSRRERPWRARCEPQGRSLAVRAAHR